MELDYELARVIVAVGGTALAAYQDNQTSFIDEKVTYSMIVAGAILALASFDVSFIIPVFLGGAIIFGIGYFLYKTGKLGGGDVLLFTGIHLLLPYKPAAFAGALSSFFSPEAAYKIALLDSSGYAPPFVLGIFVLSTLLALFGSAALYAPMLRGRKLKPSFFEAAAALLAAAVVLAALYGAGHFNALQTSLWALLLAPAVFLFVFRNQIMDELVVKQVAISQVEDEDVLVLSKMPAKIVEKYSLGPVLTTSEVDKLKKIQSAEGMRLFPVAKVLPRLGPYILVALLLSILGLDFNSLLIAFYSL